jgi:hypothetical protein
MRSISLLALVSSAFVTLLVACGGHSVRVNLLANRWSTGEHKKCSFLAPSDLICDSKQPMTHREADAAKESLKSSIVIERGEYDVSFSFRPTDYTLWDCRKTSGDSVVISCGLIRKPTTSVLAAIQAVEEDEQEIAAINAEFEDAHAKYKTENERCATVAFSQYEACKRAALKIVTDKSDSIQPRLNDLSAKTKRDRQKLEQSLAN